jgi:hypothetical protein
MEFELIYRGKTQALDLSHGASIQDATIAAAQYIEKQAQAKSSVTKIVWNGCDCYIEADDAVRLGHDFDGEKLYHGAVAFSVFDATEIEVEDLPKDEYGEPDFDGVFGTETGKFYVRAA